MEFETFCDCHFRDRQSLRTVARPAAGYGVVDFCEFPIAHAMKGGQAHPDGWDDDTYTNVLREFGKREYFRPLLEAMRPTEVNPVARTQEPRKHDKANHWHDRAEQVPPDYPRASDNVMKP